MVLFLNCAEPMLNSQNSLSEWFSSSSSPKHWLFMASLLASFYLLALVNHEQISFMPDILLHFDRYRDRNLFHPSSSSRFLSMFYIPNTIWIAPHANKGYLWSVNFYSVSIEIMFELLWKLPFWATVQFFCIIIFCICFRIYKEAKQSCSFEH